MTSVANQRSSRDSGYDIDRLISMYEIEDADLDRIREFGKGLITRLDRYIELFYEWMGPLPEYETFFSDPDRLAYAQKMQIGYWESFFKAHLDEDYAETRSTVGRVHVDIGLSLDAYFAGMNKSMRIMVDH